jgi:Ras-related protein Rab-11A
VIPQFYRGSEGALAVFDLTKHDSFDHITNWIEEVHRHTPSDLPIVLVGNKSDLVEQRQVSCQEATALAERLNLSYMETSALNATNVEQAFILLVTSIYHKKMPKQIDSSQASSSEKSSATVTIDHSSTRTISLPSDSTSKSDKSIRPSNKEKASSTKKDGCCVIS